MLYRTYRPKGFSEVVGQEHIVRTLQGALETGRIGHAYLFAGPRGTGKTTLARIYAKALNCAKFGAAGAVVPCNECPACLAVNENRSLDLLEIDAASNRGIDEIRNLKESAATAASGGGYKVFLIDEVHMLTKDAFNALLKVLEEPPSHVVFILATTEPHKILPTVLSRVQRFDFKRLTPGEIVSKLKTVADSERIQISADGLAAIAASADGALRDAEVSLTKIRTIIPSGPISLEQVNQALGLIPHAYHPEFLHLLLENDKPAAVAFLHKIHDAGIDTDHFAKEFLAYARLVLIASVSPQTVAAVGGQSVLDELARFTSVDQQKIIAIIRSFTAARSQIKSSPIPQLPLELAVLQL
ncbi:MAG TPA: DNA polymerase III subunit gamma/tau [Candidatus Paceibacterota bacterium]|nr:DNA polymerase III subunit gamma/tau [Candidatus Paceibacterota bacterium]